MGHSEKITHRPHYATPAEVAEYRRTNVRVLAQERYEGKGPAYIKDGRRVLYAWADVEAYMEANTRHTPGSRTSRQANVAA